ncbi:hypothetical protein [Deinococcus sp.]|uniref:hypothetical protein n=1 Tax=Deinococcus sp. TaxID=47478 RepID=UPI003B58DFEE
MRFLVGFLRSLASLTFAVVAVLCWPMCWLAAFFGIISLGGATPEEERLASGFVAGLLVLGVTPIILSLTYRRWGRPWRAIPLLKIVGGLVGATLLLFLLINIGLASS